jgi:murein DD-endopeptidase MepM/ murein hydrolase activator NlpD
MRNAEGSISDFGFRISDPTNAERRLRNAERILVLSCLLLAFAAGCARNRATPAAPPPPRQRIVIDYRWGWYHPADGIETLAQIAERYQRSPPLVARLNKADPSSRPHAGNMIYIPPNNDVAFVRRALVYINEHPEIVPTTPWDPAMLKRAPQPLKDRVEIKQADAAGLKSVVDGLPPRALAFDAAKAPSPRPTASPGRAPPAKDRTVAQAGVDDSGILDRLRGNNAPRFDWPVNGRVVTPFSEGWRMACHGIEIAADPGVPVRAARAGKVLLAQPFPGYGKLILIDHGDGYASVYAYLDKMLVKEGRAINQGDKIATVGHKGSTPLLFFQVRKQGKKVDPMDYLNR